MFLLAEVMAALRPAAIAIDLGIATSLSVTAQGLYTSGLVFQAVSTTAAAAVSAADKSHEVIICASAFHTTSWLGLACNHSVLSADAASSCYDVADLHQTMTLTLVL